MPTLVGACCLVGRHRDGIEVELTVVQPEIPLAVLDPAGVDHEPRPRLLVARAIAQEAESAALPVVAADC